jgi:hypothetical protein
MKELGLAIVVTAVVALFVPLAVHARGTRSLPPVPTPGAATPIAASTPAGTPTEVATLAPSGPGSINIEEKEFALASSSTGDAAGSLTFHVANKGQVAHEFVVVKSDLAPEALPLANGSVDEKQVQIVSRTPQITNGKTADLKVSLTAGKYILICNLPAHYQSGMHAGFTVQ